MHSTSNPQNIFLTRCNSSAWAQPSSTATHCLCSDRPLQSLSPSPNFFCGSGGYAGEERHGRTGSTSCSFGRGSWSRLAWRSWRQGGMKPVPPWQRYMQEGVGDMIWTCPAVDALAGREAGGRGALPRESSAAGGETPSACARAACTSGVEEPASAQTRVWKRVVAGQDGGWALSVARCVGL
jgi:hypothetical protein